MNSARKGRERLIWLKGIRLMRSKKKPGKFAAILLVVPSLIFLSACSGIRVKVATDCAWAEEIRFSAKTKIWLEDLDWPLEAAEDFNQIAIHNDLYERFCLEGE